MKRIITYSVLLGLALVFTQCTPPDGSAENAAQVQTEEKALPVRVMELQTSTLQETIEYTGNLTAFEEVYLSSSAPGRIEKLYVEIGDHVKKGQVIAQLDKTQLHQARVQLQNLETDYRRLDTLQKVGGISKQQYDQMKTQWEIAKSNVEFLEENTRLTSPINGIITGKYFEDGEMFSGAPNTQAGKAALVSIMQINPLKVMVNVSERYYPELNEGMEAAVSLDIYSGESFRGKIYRIHPTVNSMTRSFPVEISIPNRSEKLRPGMFARVSVELGEMEALVVPVLAVLQQEGTNSRYVFIHENGNARKVNVTLGKRYNDKVVIESPEIQLGDQLIVAGQTKLEDGSKVVVQEMLP